MDIQTTARRITSTLFITQSLGSAGFIAVATVNSIAGAHLSGQAALAGVPSAVYLLGSAFSALVWGDLMERIGRRASLLAGLFSGILGAGVAVLALLRESFGIFLAGMVLMGIANAALQLSRFISAEVHPPQERGRAISNVVLGGTVGAIIGPLIVGPSGAWMARRGLEELAGSFGVAMLLLALALGVIFWRLRPEPREFARLVSHQHPAANGLDGHARPTWEILTASGPLTAILAMIFSQVVMVMLMVITGLHMKGHQHGLSDISLVISSHTFGMFAFSIISGRLSDRYGRGPVILAGSATLVLSCLLAPLSPERLPLAVSLFLLGLGWNFCFVGGSSLLADHLSPAERTHIQGLNDLMIGLSSAVGSLGSGVVFAALGYGAMSLVGAATALIPLFAILRWQMQRPNSAST